MTTHKQKVILVGSDEELLWLRNAVLQSAGFDVVSTADENHASERIRQGHCEVLLMCYSLSSSVRQRLAQIARMFCPLARIIAITDAKLEKAEFADTFVYGIDGPEALIEAIHG